VRGPRQRHALRARLQRYVPHERLALYALTAVAIVLAVIWNGRRQRAELDRTIERRLLELAHVEHGRVDGD